MSLTIQRGENVLPTYLVAPAVPYIAPTTPITTCALGKIIRCVTNCFLTNFRVSHALVDSDYVDQIFVSISVTLCDINITLLRIKF